MERGALLRKHSIDSVVLCLLLCISFFTANTSYSDYIEDPGMWYIYSYITAASPDQLSAVSSTFIYPAAYGQYQATRLRMELTYPSGYRWLFNLYCGTQCYYEKVVDRTPGIWDLETIHYADLSHPCYNVLGTTSDTFDATQVEVDYFYASPQTIPPSGSSTLYWSTFNGTSIDIDGTPVSGTGSMVVSPTSTTIYTLTVSNQYSYTQAQASVRTNEPLVPEFYQYSMRHEKGMSPFFPYTSVAQESVNSANGNLFFTVPLLSRPGRNGLGLDLSLAYNSKIWDFNGGYATLAEYDSWVGTGWTLTMGRVLDDSANGYYYVTSADGANHTLQYYGGAWRSVDSTYMVYDPSAHKLTLKGGTTLQFGYQDPVRPYIRHATRIQDTNGNYLNISYSGANGAIDTITDTLGNTYTFLLNSNGQLEYIRYLNTNDTTEATSTISLDYEPMSLEFGSGANTDPLIQTQQMLSHVTYITGIRYGFDYTSSGEVTEIIYPTLGSSRYFYSNRNIYDRVLGSMVADHYVSSHDTGGGTPVWNWDILQQGSYGPKAVEVEIPGRANPIHYMEKISSGWADGFVTRIKRADSLSQELHQDWIQDDEQLSTIFNPRPAWAEGGMKETASPYEEKFLRTEYTYAAASDYSGNVKEIRQYDFTGALRRKTVVNYLHESYSSYVPLNILDRITSTLIYDGSNNLVSKTTTAYDSLSLYGAPNAINHDSNYGTSFLTRGLPTSTKTWYDIAQDDYIVSSIKYDECGNPREATDPRSYTSYLEYWLSAADNAYAFPLRRTNPKGHVAQATYSYKSGVTLSSTNVNNLTTTMSYDDHDRITEINEPNGGRTTYIYVESPSYSFPPYAFVRKYMDVSNYIEKRVDLDVMGRPEEVTALGNIKQDQSFDAASVVNERSLPHKDGETTYYASYNTGGVASKYINLPDGREIDLHNGLDSVMVEADDGRRELLYTYQEDGQIRNVMEQDPDTGVLNVGTDYYYDALGRLTSISQGVQTRTYVYDDMGRVLLRTDPESGTTSFVYDDNSNVISRTDSRGITTTYTYDELNRITHKTYSDSTPDVNNFYDSQPVDSPIMLVNPVGRLTKTTTTDSGVTISSFYSYCSCSSVSQEATIIDDGTAKTYITSYAYNIAGQLTSMTYPNGKEVNYTLGSKGRVQKVSSTYNGQPFDYIYDVDYKGPQGALTQIEYPIYRYSSRVTANYEYDPKNMFLTRLQIDGVMDYDFKYKDRNWSWRTTTQIHEIEDNWDPDESQHFVYDKMNRLKAYWISDGYYDTPSRKLEFEYDRYGNITEVEETISGQTNAYTYTVDPTTNRLMSRTYSGGTIYFTYDNAGNMTSSGAFDAENRMISSNGMDYFYDGSSRRFRKEGGSTINYVYSYSGQLLVEDNLSQTTTDNLVYFNGQMIAIQGQDESSFQLLFKNYQGSTVRTYTVDLPNYDKTLNAKYKYDPWGQIISSTEYTPPYTDYKYQEKERENGLDYFGARYYDSLAVSDGSSLRWTSPDPVISRVYDPQSLNRYSYVRNDPVNLVDPDGRMLMPKMPNDGGGYPFAPFNAPFISVVIGYSSEGIFSALLPNVYFNPIPAVPTLAVGQWFWQKDPPPMDPRTDTAIDDAESAVKKKRCHDFLADVISNLGLDITPKGLVDMLTQPGTTIIDNAKPLGTEGALWTNRRRQEIGITAEGYTSYLWASLIHEAFHLFKGIDNHILEPALAKASVWGPDPYINNDLTGYIVRNCQDGVGRGAASGGTRRRK